MKQRKQKENIQRLGKNLKRNEQHITERTRGMNPRGTTREFNRVPEDTEGEFSEIIGKSTQELRNAGTISQRQERVPVKADPRLNEMNILPRKRYPTRFSFWVKGKIEIQKQREHREFIA